MTLDDLWRRFDEDGELGATADELAEAWRASDSPAAVYSLGGIGVERPRLIAALVAAAELAAGVLPAEDLAAIEVARRWLAGTATVEDAERVLERGMSAWQTASSAGDADRMAATTASLGPVSVIVAKPSRLPPSRAVHALDCAGIVAGRRNVADVLRAHLPCPRPDVRR
ncbi:MAG TPA: hypothetical protein VGL61_07415 [Kofleriaceae bacterium]|jgi:hypothetical protein